MTATEEHVSGRQGADQPRRIRISRLRHGAAQPHVEEFDVAVGPETTLLDALREIRSHQDRSLTLRYSCCHASCGTCGMRANGHEVLACVTPLASLGTGPILVEPLANARVEHDLVVDMRDLYDEPRADRAAADQAGRAAGRPRRARPILRPVRGLHRMRAVCVGVPDHRVGSALPRAGRAGRGLAHGGRASWR